MWRVRPHRRRVGKQRPLGSNDVGDAVDGQVDERIELGAVEGLALSGALYLDEPAGPGHDHIEVDLRRRILDVGKVQPGLTLHDADRDGRQLVGERVGGQVAGDHQPLECVVQCDEAAADGGGAGAAVGLDDVAVDGDLALPQCPEVADGPQGPADETLDLLAATRDPSADPLSAGARQHRVLGGDPATARPLQPTRHSVADRGGAQHTGAPERHQARAVGGIGEVALERKGAQFVVSASVGSHQVRSSKWLGDVRVLAT